MKVTSQRVILIALTCNVVIFGVKALSAWLSGSSAIFSETLHSLADSMNSIVLVIGIKRALLPPNKQHPFGYTRAIYFWSFVGAVIMFMVIATGSIYRGYQQVLDPSEIKFQTISFVTLLISMAFEGVAVIFAVKGLLNSTNSLKNRDMGLIRRFIECKDPAIKQIFVEDFLSLSGVVLAFVGLVLVDIFGIIALDGYTGIAIGVIIGLLAIYLMNENRKKLLGESASPEMETMIREQAMADSRVKNVLSLKTLQIGTNKIWAYMVVELDPHMPVEYVDDITYKLEKRIISKTPDVVDCFIEVIASDCEPCKERIKKKDKWMYPKKDKTIGKR
jgi:cation diffusion facilitator family transporter